MFKELRYIDGAFRWMRGFSLVVNLGWMLVCGYAVYRSYRFAQTVQGKIYILANGKAIEAFATDRQANFPVEARDHVRRFHEYFFDLDPDEQVIQSRIGEALYLADASAKRAYDNLREKGYYTNLIAANVSQQISIDSIALDMDHLPVYFRCYATQEFVRATSRVTRALITEGWLRSVQRSDHNPHGFLIERWNTILNKDIKTEQR